jgi:colanic acid/amylovoran biosynthesis glycosyltransferase
MHRRHRNRGVGVTHQLGVLTPEIGVLSETFVEWDCNQLLPGRTAVVADPPPLGETVLREPTWKVHGPLLESPPEAGDPPPTPELQDTVERFLRDQGVQVLLVQYLDLADRWFDLLERLPIPVWVRGHGADLSARLHPRSARLAGLAGVVVPTLAAAVRLAPGLLPAHQVHVVANHVDVPSRPPGRRDGADVRCLAVGRLVEKKGHAGLLRAFGEARRHQPGMTLDIVGDGPLRHDLADLVWALDLVDSVRLLGARPPEEVLARTARADVVMHPSVTGPDGDCEGQPLAVLQAMAAARPCVVTDHAGITETIADGESAMVVREHDVDQLAKALLTLAEQPALRARLGNAAWHVATTRHSHLAVRPRLLRLLGLEDHP